MKTSKKLIVFEGIDGSGKATQSKLLAEALKKLGQKVKLVSFPTVNDDLLDFSKDKLKNCSLNSMIKETNTFAVSSLFALDRYLSFKNSWEENYKNGEFIIADRYTTSNAIYQGTRMKKIYRDLFHSWIFDYEYCKLGLPRPNLVFYLRVPVKEAQKLLTKRYEGDDSRKDLYEKDMSFLETCQRVAMFLASQYNWHVIDCFDSCIQKIKSIDVIFNLVLTRVKKYFNL